MSGYKNNIIGGGQNSTVNTTYNVQHTYGTIIGGYGNILHQSDPRIKYLERKLKIQKIIICFKDEEIEELKKRLNIIGKNV